ncbi:putative IMPACT (imprinted ancient) family translation regulator [Methanomicrobium sp. W14]|uniref:YigZ family protein n=1 Tax=Methanomicrobium sp. W14 TaxID=2817839 RepID=UPI001AE8CBBB|nr:YigZ family protein [Methanomicrobium sp. W14]MBP2133436.1 putative IMPACT (imprinted ancient) family translation regulator [Methanomicrobium sp. W14]
MQELSAVKYEEKKSRFYAHLYRIYSHEEYPEILKIHAKTYKKAAHHCSAINFSDSGGRVFREFKNDGEVGHPGRILSSVLEKNSLDSHAIVVSRIFGGIKLGPAGVSRAFRDSGEACVKVYLEKK